VCLVGSGALFLGVGLLRDVWLIAAGLLVLSIVSESFRPACMAAMAHRAPPRLRVRSFALLRLAVNLGMGVGPAVAGWLALVDYRLLFVADGLTSWAAAGVLPFVPLALAAPDDGGAPRTRSGSPWSDPPFLLLMLTVTLLATVFFQILGTMPLYFSEVYGFGEGAIGLLLAFNAALIVAFEMVLIHRAERHDRLLLIGAGALCIGGGFALMPLGHTAGWVALTIAVWTLGEMLALPLLNVVAADRAGAGHRGRYMGMYALAYSTAFICAPAIGTWVYEHVGPHAVWYAAGLATVPLAFAFALLRRAFR
jgi:MFS family permease